MNRTTAVSVIVGMLIICGGIFFVGNHIKDDTAKDQQIATLLDWKGWAEKTITKYEELTKDQSAKISDLQSLTGTQAVTIARQRTERAEALNLATDAERGFQDANQETIKQIRTATALQQRILADAKRATVSKVTDRTTDSSLIADIAALKGTLKSYEEDLIPKLSKANAELRQQSKRAVEDELQAKEASLKSRASLITVRDHLYQRQRHYDKIPRRWFRPKVRKELKGVEEKINP